jgi:tRNA pseudouridine55 synthase
MKVNNAQGVTETSGLLLLKKKSGITSFEALNAVKKAFATTKAGHTGTLDKFAEGLLVVLVGRAVKLSPWFSGCDKYYEGTIRFGTETDTLDPEGIPVAEGEIPSKETLEKVLPSFRGNILQSPPLYSAVHIDGKRAHVLARSGYSPPMKERSVSIYALELLSYVPPLASIRVHCSKGTYIRSLARDIAQAAGSRAHLSALTRTQAAGFHLAEAVSLDSGGEAEFYQKLLRPIDTGVFEALRLPYCFADERGVIKIIQGKPLETFIHGDWFRWPRPFPEGEAFAAGIFRGGGTGDFVGIIEKKAGLWGYGYVYARS